MAFPHSWVNIPMLNGDQSIHIRKHHDLSHWQQVVRPALDFIQYTPHNMYSNLLEVQISIFVDGGPILHMCFLTTRPQHAWSPRVPSAFWLCCVIKIQAHWRLHSPRWASYDMMTHQFCLVRCQLQDKHKLCLVVELVSVCEKVQRFSVLRDLQNLLQDGHMSSRAMCSLSRITPWHVHGTSIRVQPGTTARISVCGGCAGASKTAECLSATDRPSGFHAAHCDARRHIHKYTLDV